MIHVITISGLFPNREQPRHGIFVAERLRHLRAQPGFAFHVVAPVPWFPFQSPRFGRYGAFARVPRREEFLGETVRHPRYIAIPKVGMAVAPFLYSAGVLPTVRELAASLPGPVVLDGHFLYPDGVATALIARRLGLPFVLTARGNDATLYPRFRVPRYLIRRACATAHRVITVSEALRDHLLALGLAPDRVVVQRNGVDLDRFPAIDRREARRRLGFSRPTIVSVGHLIPRKDHRLLIGALRFLDGVDLVIIGEGPLHGELSAEARRLGMEGRVRIIGNMPQHELAWYYAAADLSALTSLREGMPNVVLESLACGTPVVATAVEGVAELLTDPGVGVVVTERQPEAIATAIRQVLVRAPSQQSVRHHAAGLGWAPTVTGVLEVLAGAAANPLRAYARSGA